MISDWKLEIRVWNLASEIATTQGEILKKTQKSKVKNQNDNLKCENLTNPNIKIQMTIEIQMSKCQR